MHDISRSLGPAGISVGLRFLGIRLVLTTDPQSMMGYDHNGLAHVSMNFPHGLSLSESWRRVDTVYRSERNVVVPLAVRSPI